MLRLVSVVGITLAMVIGFVALSSQMRDDFEVRTKVVKSIDDMKAIALQQLDCNPAESVTDSDNPGTFKHNQDQQQIDIEDQDADRASSTEDSSAGIVSSMGYENIDENTVEVVAAFKDVIGESGKLRIKSGRQIAIRCSCDETNLTCQIVGSDINKKYVPSKISK